LAVFVSNFFKSPFCILTHYHIVQILGYGGRAWSHFDPLKLGGYIMQSTLILIAPALFAASIYMILSRLIRVLDAEQLSIIPVRWMTKIFVFGDVVSFFMQAGGGGIQASGNFLTGQKIIIFGLFVQIFMFSFFLVTAVAFHRNVLKQSTALIFSYIVDWRRYLHILYITSILILVRSIFRVVEYLQGHDGFLVSHEVFIYIFDALLMFLVMVIFAIWYIGDLQQKKVRTYHPVNIAW
jgi:hypothetical protein